MSKYSSLQKVRSRKRETECSAEATEPRRMPTDYDNVGTTHKRRFDE